VPVTDETGRYRRALSYLDKSFFEGRWKLPPDWLRASEPLFTLDHDRQVTMRDFLRWLYAHQWKRPDAYRYRRAILDRLYAQFKDDMRQSYYEQHLDKWYPDFARTAREYYDGLLLFRYKSRQIWEKALKDTVGLRRFYEQNKERYRQPTRYRLVEILTPDKKRARQWYRKLKRGKMTMEDVMKLKNQGARVRLTVVEESALPGVFKKRKAQWAQTPGGQYQVRAVVDVIPTHIPPLDKIKGKVLSDYQQKLEKDLLRELHTKYPVRINEDVWNQIRRKYKK
jgi:peptidyl-prolyl cis-trans isomerase SurA